MSRIDLNFSHFQTIHLDPYNKRDHRQENGFDSIRRRTKKRIQLELNRYRKSATWPKLILLLIIVGLSFFTFLVTVKSFTKLWVYNHEPLKPLRNGVSIIVPTYKEKGNLELLTTETFRVLKAAGIEGELLILDDNSDDGSIEQVEDLIYKGFNVSIYVRKKEKGLSSAVLLGFSYAQYDTMMVMDADLSHDVDSIPKLVQPIVDGISDFSIGSRYMEGGGTKDWPLKRRIISWGATLLAWPLVDLSDPMSGFFAIRKSLFLEGRNVNPTGFKIALELVVKCQPTHVSEIAYVFKDRVVGQSKLKLKTQIQYLLQVLSLLWFLYPFSIIVLSVIVLSLILVTLLGGKRLDSSTTTSMDSFKTDERPGLHFY